MGEGKSSSIEKQTEKLLVPVFEEMSHTPDASGNVKNYELVDVEYVKEGGSRYLRIYADKEGGITINDCESVSRQIETVLDEADLIRDSYILEVSSPGLTRTLKKERDYLKNLEKPVEVHLYKPLEVNHEKFKLFIGDLKAYDAEKIVLDIGEKKEERIEIERKNISVIKQYVAF